MPRHIERHKTDKKRHWKKDDRGWERHTGVQSDKHAKQPTEQSSAFCSKPSFTNMVQNNVSVHFSCESIWMRNSKITYSFLSPGFPGYSGDLRKGEGCSHPTWYHRGSEWLAKEGGTPGAGHPDTLWGTPCSVRSKMNRPHDLELLQWPPYLIRRKSIAFLSRATGQCHRDFHPQLHRANFYPHVKGENNPVL